MTIPVRARSLLHAQPETPSSVLFASNATTKTTASGNNFPQHQRFLKLKFSLPLRNAPYATLSIDTVIGKEILRARRRSRNEMKKVEVSHSNKNISS
jgi:hypothetical protein